MAISVTGPIGGGRHGWAFGAAAFDLEALGYLEEEWFLEGEAACYDHVSGSPPHFDGRWEVKEIGGVPYKTRLLVRRPRDLAAFNGTVVAFWTNVSLGFEILTGESTELYRGFAFVGVMAQSVAITGYAREPARGVALWDPERYSSLNIPTDNASYDIFHQALRAIGPDRPAGAADPLGGAAATNVIAFGASQSAARLATYFNAVHPLDPVADQLILDVYFGSGAPLNLPDTGTPRITHVEQINENLRSGGGPGRGTHLLREDLDAKVFVLNSETESLSHFWVRQPDSDTYRFWELAGHAHGTVPQRERLRSSWARDLGIAMHPLAPESGYNTLSLEPARSRVLKHVHEWLHHGTPPPAQPRLDIAGDAPVIQRDALGNATAGVRMPYLEVATGRHSGFAADGSFSLFGSSIPFDPGTLRTLYGDGSTYRARLCEATERAVAEEVLLEADAEPLYERLLEEEPQSSALSLS